MPAGTRSWRRSVSSATDSVQSGARGADRRILRLPRSCRAIHSGAGAIIPLLIVLPVVDTPRGTYQILGFVYRAIFSCAWDPASATTARKARQSAVSSPSNRFDYTAMVLRPLPGPQVIAPVLLQAVYLEPTASETPTLLQGPCPISVRARSRSSERGPASRHRLAAHRKSRPCSRRRQVSGVCGA